MLGKTILICLIKDIYFTHIVVFIMKLCEVASVLSPEISTDISIPGSVCPFCLSPHWSEKAPSCSLPSQHSQDSAFGQQTQGFWTHASDSRVYVCTNTPCLHSAFCIGVPWNLVCAKPAALWKSSLSLTFIILRLSCKAPRLPHQPRLASWYSCKGTGTPGRNYAKYQVQDPTKWLTSGLLKAQGFPMAVPSGHSNPSLKQLRRCSALCWAQPLGLSKVSSCCL